MNKCHGLIVGEKLDVLKTYIYVWQTSSDEQAACMLNVSQSYCVGCLIVDRKSKMHNCKIRIQIVKGKRLVRRKKFKKIWYNDSQKWKERKICQNYRITSAPKSQWHCEKNGQKWFCDNRRLLSLVEDTRTYLVHWAT